MCRFIGAGRSGAVGDKEGRSLPQPCVHVRVQRAGRVGEPVSDSDKVGRVGRGEFAQRACRGNQDRC